MFAAIVTRFAKPARDYSAEFAARRAARNAETARLARIVGEHMARASHQPDGMPSMIGAGQAQARSDEREWVEDMIRRETTKARDIARAGHRLYKATARALVEASGK